MCGIAGILRVYDPGEPVPPPLVSIPEAWLDILDDSIKHRGPDGRGRFRDRVIRREDGATVDVALVHRRLSILDHAGGHQPMVSVAKGAGVIAAKRASGPGWLLYEDPSDPAISAWAERASSGTSSTRAGIASDRTDSPASPDSPAADDLIAVVFNGCIYNHRELRRELQAAGHVFTSDHSDTEVLVHGWREWNYGVFQRADGMHATVVWDHRTGELCFARDFAGEKPLKHTWIRPLGVGLVCSSTAGLTRLRHSLDPSWLVRNASQAGISWLWSGGARAGDCPGEIEDQSTVTCQFFRPGWKSGLYDAELVWHPDARRQEPRLDAESVDSLLQRSVAARLDADVPVGVFLSSGIDSSLIAVHAQRLTKQRGSSVAAYTVRMPQADLDESEEAARIASTLGIPHHVLDCEPFPGEDLKKLIEQLGLPFGDSSLLPTHWVSRAVRRYAAVSLTGDGADELFGGYERHRVATLLNEHHEAIRTLPLSIVPERSPKGMFAKARRLIGAAKGAGYADLLAIYQTVDFRRIVNSKTGMPFLMTEDPLEYDLRWYLRDDLLRKTDSASMAVALEVRSPFLSRALIDACLSEPLSSLMPNGQRKGLLKQVARKYLPADIVDRPKQGFAIPIGEWFRSDYGGLRQLLLDHLLGPEPFGPDSLGINSMINMGFVKQMLKEHDDAGSASIWPWKGRDHSQRLYMLLVLSIWAKWLGGLGRGSGQALPSSRSA